MGRKESNQTNLFMTSNQMHEQTEKSQFCVGTLLCYALLCVLSRWYCSLSLPHGAVGWSAVSDFSISCHLDTHFLNVHQYMHYYYIEGVH